MLVQPTTQKYQAKRVYWNLVTKNVVTTQWVEQYRRNGRLELPSCIAKFDSQLEFKVYLELVRMYGDDRIIRQFPLEIFPRGYCYPRGKVWKVDFAIKRYETDAYPTAYVEAKGAFLPEFGYTLAALEAEYPDEFEQVYIVFSNTLPKENKMFKNLQKSPMAERLLTYKQLQNRGKLI